MTLPLLLGLAGCPPELGEGLLGDDDSSTGDDDVVDDDDTTPDDDDMTPDDDDAVPAYGVRVDDGSAPRHPGLRRLLGA